MAPKITLSYVKRRMEPRRKAFLSKARNPKDIRMANDKEMFEFICRNFVYMYDIYHGDIEMFGDIPYEYADEYRTQTLNITFKENYDYVCEIYKENIEYDPNDKDARFLLDLARRLRKRYAR